MHILELAELDRTLKEFVNAIAFRFERIYHGTPSGIDNHIASYGNMLVFNKKEQKSLSVGRLPYKIMLIDSQVEKSTKKAVARVREIYDNTHLGTIGKSAIDMIGSVTDQIIHLVSENSSDFDEKTFENLIRINHSLLRLFDLSHAAIENIMGLF